MTALTTIEKIINTNLVNLNLKYCLVDSAKRPYRYDGLLAKPNNIDDFVSMEKLLSYNGNNYVGVGISIQASKICAIDVDKCFSIPNDILSADERAKDILKRFKNIAYCEFSFSGTGLRIIFLAKIIENYSDNYYIKNSINNIEFYQPSNSFRYVTITGNKIFDNNIIYEQHNDDILKLFLNDYMKKSVKQIHVKSNENRDFETLFKLTKYTYLTDFKFQDLWFSNAPGSGKNESEKDFQLLVLIFENITTDKDMIRKIFESSPYFKSKDFKHINKWEYNNHRYYEYIFKKITQ